MFDRAPGGLGIGLAPAVMKVLCLAIVVGVYRLVTGGDELLRRALHRLLLVIGQNDGGASFSERPCRRQTHACRSSGEECHLSPIVERVVHPLYPLFVRS